MEFKILTEKLLEDYTQRVEESPLDKVNRIKKIDMPVDYFQFINLYLLFIHLRSRGRILTSTVISNINS